MKQCCRCREHKPVDQFSKNKRTPDGLQRHCKTCQRDSNATYYTENKDKFIEHGRRNRRMLTDEVNAYKTSCGCKYCPEDRFWCLDFHHPNPDKEFTVSQVISRVSKAKIFEEIAKCEVVCRNCHADIHYQQSMDL